MKYFSNSLDMMFILPLFSRPPAFYGQFSLKISVAIQSMFYCTSLPEQTEHKMQNKKVCLAGILSTVLSCYFIIVGLQFVD